jgi:hypothetical protein
MYPVNSPASPHLDHHALRLGAAHRLRRPRLRRALQPDPLRLTLGEGYHAINIIFMSHYDAMMDTIAMLAILAPTCAVLSVRAFLPAARVLVT